jgi:hypothetical protein
LLFEQARYAEEGTMKILLALDGSEHGEAAAQAVARRPWPPGSTVKIASVVDLSTYLGPPFVPVLAEYAEQVEEARRAHGPAHVP